MFFTNLENLFNNLINTLLGYTSSFYSIFQTAVLGGIVIYIMMMGFSVISGGLQSPLPHVVKNLLKIMVIHFISITSYKAIDNSGFILGGADGFVLGLGSDIINAVGASSDGGSLGARTDTLFEKGLFLGSECLARVIDLSLLSSPTVILSWLLSAVIIIISVCALCVYSFAMLIMNKVMLALLAMVAPLFITSLMFPPIAKWFDSWFSQVISFTFEYIFIMLLLGVQITILIDFMGKFLPYVQGSEGATLSFAIPMQLMILCIFFIYSLTKITQLASALSGGITNQSISVGSLMSPVAAPITNVSSTASKMALNKILKR